MRFEHGSLRAECLAALIILLCCCCCCRRGRGAAAAEVPLPPPFGDFSGVPPGAAASSSSTARLRTFRQCLRLEEGVGPREACGAHGGHVRLRFCDAYEPARALGPLPCDGPALDRLRELDNAAREAACAFRQLIERYDCENANSVSWTCKDCEEAYKQWVCAMFLPPVRLKYGGGREEGEGVKPCRYICRLVEQRCPYFHPSVRDQYAGERVFKCIDPDIPDLDSIHGVSSYGPPHRCYCPQHLGAPEAEEEDEECRLLTPTQQTTSRRRNATSAAAAAVTAQHHRTGTTSTATALASASVTLIAALTLTLASTKCTSSRMLTSTSTLSFAVAALLATLATSNATTLASVSVKVIVALFALTLTSKKVTSVLTSTSRTLLLLASTSTPSRTLLVLRRLLTPWTVALALTVMTTLFWAR